MKIEICEYEVVLSGAMTEHLREFAIGVMDLMRSAYPDTAWCWNACRVWFEDGQPQFSYGEDIESTYETDLPHLDVFHPTLICAPWAKKSAKAGKKGGKK